jgi:hypothetical protein
MIMAANFIGPLIILIGVVSFVGIIFGLLKKNKKISTVSLIAFAFVALIFALEFLVFE